MLRSSNKVRVKDREQTREDAGGNPSERSTPPRVVDVRSSIEVSVILSRKGFPGRTEFTGNDSVRDTDSHPLYVTRLTGPSIMSMSVGRYRRQDVST